MYCSHCAVNPLTASGVMPSHRVSSSRLRPSKKPSVSASGDRHASKPFIRSPINRWHLSSDQAHSGRVCVRWIRSMKPVLTSRLSILVESGFRGIPRFRDATASNSWSLNRGQFSGSGYVFAVWKVLRSLRQGHTVNWSSRKPYYKPSQQVVRGTFVCGKVCRTQSTKVISI